MLIPTGLLGVLPLQGALSERGAASFGERWITSLAPSVRSLVDCRARAEAAKAAPPSFFGIFDPRGDLAGARLEELALKRIFARTDPKTLHGNEVVREPVVAGMSTAAIFHASTHGHHHPFLPDQSGVALAGSDLLTVGSLRQALMSGTRLVFLSACETGLAGVLKLAEEFVGLGASFVGAGAACVVASLWPVLDDASFLLTERFYTELLDTNCTERQSPAVALSAAQAWLRTVTYGGLQQDYEVETVGKDQFLLIGRRRSTPTPAISDGAAPGLLRRWFRGTRSGGGVGHAAAVAKGDTPQPIRLRLGADHERPFASPHEWAAFTVTGA